MRWPSRYSKDAVRFPHRMSRAIQVICGVCHPYSGHLYEKLGAVDGLTMTIDFCDEYVEACEGQIAFSDDYCEIHTLGGETDAYWSYPLDIQTSENAYVHAVGVMRFFRVPPADVYNVDHVSVAHPVAQCELESLINPHSGGM